MISSREEGEHGSGAHKGLEQPRTLVSSRGLPGHPGQRLATLFLVTTRGCHWHMVGRGWDDATRHRTAPRHLPLTETKTPAHEMSSVEAEQLLYSNGLRLQTGPDGLGRSLTPALRALHSHMRTYIICPPEKAARLVCSHFHCVCYTVQYSVPAE